MQKDIVSRIRGEVRAHPKKAAVLGLLGLVAAYYWAPLVWGWIEPDETTPDVEVGSTSGGLDLTFLGEIAPPSSASTPPAPTAPRACSWKQLSNWIGQDSATQAAEDLSERRNPFAAVGALERGSAEDEEEAIQDQPTPEVLGVALSGTIVGGRRRVALIDGKAYKEGDIASLGSAGSPVQFELIEVRARSVVLERQGERFELKLRGRQAAGRGEIVYNSGDKR